MISRSKLFFLVLLGIGLSGCASGNVVTRRFFWPALPERPRIEWLKTYSSQADFSSGGFGDVMTDLFGEAEPLTFDKPVDIKSDGNGRVYISDAGLNKVVVYDLVKKDVHYLAGGQASLMANPTALTLDANGNLYVADVDRRVILIFDKSERLVGKIELGNKITRVGGMVIDAPRNRLICTDVRGHKLLIFSMTGDLLQTIGERGDGDGQFNFPGPVVVDKKGEIIVGDSLNARIQIFDEHGKFLRKFGQRGDSPSEFQLLKGLALDSDGDIYVTDGKGNKVSIYNQQGEYLLTFGRRFAIEPGRDVAAGFLIPQGIDIDRNDRIYIVDQINRRFQVFQYISDSFLAQHPIPGYPPGQAGK